LIEEKLNSNYDIGKNKVKNGAKTAAEIISGFL
jgi:hypothetical protein